MSAIVQAAAAVAATPAPQVIHTVITNTVPAQVPAVVIQAAQLAAVFVITLILSVFHKVAEYVTAKEKGWGQTANTLIATGYSLLVGVVGTASTHQIGTDLTALVALGLNTSVAFSGSFWTYAVRKVVADLSGAGASVATASITPVLAVEDTPAAG